MNPILITHHTCRNSKPSKFRLCTFAAGATLLLVAGATTSCSTTKGFGRDVEKTGEKIQDAAAR